MGSSIVCSQNAANLSEEELDQTALQLFKRIEEELEQEAPGYIKTCLRGSVEESGDDAIAYKFSQWLNTTLVYKKLSQYDEYRIRQKLAIIHCINYFGLAEGSPFDPKSDFCPPGMGSIGEKTRRCGLWRWMVIMGKHTIEARMNDKILPTLTETITYCRSMVQALRLDWSEDHILSAAMSYIELNHRR